MFLKFICVICFLQSQTKINLCVAEQVHDRSMRLRYEALRRASVASRRRVHAACSGSSRCQPNGRRTGDMRNAASIESGFAAAYWAASTAPRDVPCRAPWRRQRRGRRSGEKGRGQALGTMVRGVVHAGRPQVLSPRWVRCERGLLRTRRRKGVSPGSAASSASSAVRDELQMSAGWIYVG